MKIYGKSYHIGSEDCYFCLGKVVPDLFHDGEQALFSLKTNPIKIESRLDAQTSATIL